MRINGETHCHWQAVDHEGEILEVFATKRRDRKAALKFLRRAMKRYGSPKGVVTDRLGSYPAAMTVIGNAANQECGRWLNNRAENSHRPFRRREGAMAASASGGNGPCAFSKATIPSKPASSAVLFQTDSTFHCQRAPVHPSVASGGAKVTEAKSATAE